MKTILLAFAACTSTPPVVDDGTRWEAADALFHQDPRWLGGDGAYSIDLHDGRSLWLFGDSFIATSAAHVRTESKLVRNSVAVMTGNDPLTATMQFAWRDATPPASYFPEAGADWFWPVHGVRTPGGPLVIFLSRQREAEGGLGFEAAGYGAVRIADPSGPPSGWIVEPLATVPAPWDADATVGVCTAVDGDDLVAVAIDGAHRGRLVRWTLADVAAGDLSRPRWETQVVIDDAGSECSLTKRGDRWLHVASRGFGATTIAVRTAPALAGPWSDPVDAFTPPESLVDDAFVYAAKAHGQLAGDGLVVTYADNSFTFADLFDPAKAATLYWPHFATLAVP